MGLLSRLNRKGGKRTNGFSIEVVIPLRSSAVFDFSKVVEGFDKKWGTKVSTGEDEGSAEFKKGSKVISLTNGKSTVIVTCHSGSLPKGMFKKLTDLPGIDEAEKFALQDCRGSLLLQSPDMGEHAAERATFAAQVLLYFLEDENALGYSCKSGNFYRQRRWAASYFKRKALEPVDLFVLFDSLHFVSDSRWVHTHGLEQFGLPDIEVRYKDRWKEDYYGDLVANAAVYCIERGPVLVVGNTAEVADNGVVYKVTRPRLEPNHDCGKFGMIGLTKV